MTMIPHATNHALTPAARGASASAGASRCRIIADPFAGYLESAFAEFIPHAGFARVARRAIDGAASGPARASVTRSAASPAEDQRHVERPPAPSPSTAAPARREAPEHVHGTLTGYTNYGCRCDLCREAMSIYQAERRLRRAGALA